MTNNIYKIEPVAWAFNGQTKEAKLIGMMIDYVPFSTSMTVPCTFFTIDGAPLYTQTVVVDQIQLSLWGDNDDYIIEVVANLLGVTLIP